jgi:hypothetical protein
MPKAISAGSMPIPAWLLKSFNRDKSVVRKPVSSEDWSYQPQGGLEFQVSRWFWAQLGWRWLRTDFVSGAFSNKTDLNGPFIQGGVKF